MMKQYYGVPVVTCGGVSLVQLVAHWTTDHYHLSSKLGVSISEHCFIFDFASLPLEVVRPIQPIMCTKVAVKHQSSIISSSMQPLRLLKLELHQNEILNSRRSIRHHNTRLSSNFIKYQSINRVKRDMPRNEEIVPYRGSNNHRTHDLQPNARHSTTDDRIGRQRHARTESPAEQVLQFRHFCHLTSYTFQTRRHQTFYSIKRRVGAQKGQSPNTSQTACYVLQDNLRLQTPV